MSATGLYGLPTHHSLPLLSALRRDGLQVRVSTSRTQRLPHRGRTPLELERLLLPEREQVAGRVGF